MTKKRLHTGVSKIISILLVCTLLLSSLTVVATDGSDRSPPPPRDLVAGETAPIMIKGETEFAVAVSTYGWPGNGSWDNPYIIEGMEINGTNSSYCMVLTSLYQTNVIIRNNRFFGTTKYDRYGEIYENAGLGIYWSQNITVFNNTFEDHFRSGITLSYDGSQVLNNTFRGNSYGIYTEGGVSSTIAGNILEDNNYGISIEGYARIENNSVTGDGTGAGIAIRERTPRTVSYNTFSNLSTGLRIYSGTTTTYEHNTIRNCNLGISIVGESVTVAHNTIENCPSGIRLGEKSATLVNNSMSGGGITFDSRYIQEDFYRSHTIPSSNTVDGKPVLYLIDGNNVDIRPATYGEVILVGCSGVTLEDRTIDSEFWLACVYSDNVTIEGNDVDMGRSAKWIVHFTDDVVIRNNSIDDIDLDLYTSDRLELANNSIDGGTTYIAGEADVSVHNNTMVAYEGTALTVHVYMEDSLSIMDNNITMVDPGIGSYALWMDTFSMSVTLRNNSLWGAGFSDSWLYTDKNRGDYDVDTSNTVNGRPILYLDSVSNKKISGEYGQVLVTNSSRITVEGLNFGKGDGGISMWQTDDVTVTDCTFDRLMNGAVNLFFCTDISVKDSLFQDGNSMVYLNTCNEGTNPPYGDITDNYFMDLTPNPTFPAALFTYTTSLDSIKRNLFANITGMGIWGDSGNTVTEISSNEFSNCTETAYRGNFMTTKWHHNSFLNNTHPYYPSQMVYANRDNQFDDGSQGNYWSNYEDRYPNATNDGTVWDTPFAIYRDDVVDRYPLVKYTDRILPRLDLIYPDSAVVGTPASFEAVAMDNQGIVSYNWSFDNGITWTTDNSPLVDHTFTASGDFDVIVQVWDAADNLAQATGRVHVPDSIPPVARAGEDQTVIPGSRVFLDGSASTDDQDVVFYIWSFTYDDWPRELMGMMAQFNFMLAGVYNVTLTVHDFASNLGQDVVTVTVGDFEAPVAVIGDVIEVPQGTRLQLDGRDSTDNWRIEAYDWTVTSPGGTVTHSDTSQMFHNFSEVGVYTVTLRVTDAVGLWGETMVNVTVLDVTAPMARAFEDALVGQNEVLYLVGTGSTDNEGVTSWTWTIEGPSGDVTLHGAEVMHSFAKAGVHTITLTVTDAAGNSDSSSFTMTVLDTEQPVAVAGDDVTVNEGSRVTMDGSGSSDNVDIWRYTWTLVYEGEELESHSPTPDFSHTFLVPGVYTVTLTVVDPEGNAGADQVVITVLDETAPVADAGDDVVVDQHLAVIFDGTGSSDNVGIVRWTWTFMQVGAPVVLEGMTPVFVFIEVGVHTVTLEVADATGRTDTDIMTVTVRDVTAPVADAGQDLTFVEFDTATFDGSASMDNVGIVKWTWRFVHIGLEETLEGEIVTFVFEEHGEYVVTLEVADAAGLGGQDTMTVTIQASMPDGDPAPKDDDDGLSMAVVGGIVAAIVVVALVAVLLMRRR